MLKLSRTQLDEEKPKSGSIKKKEKKKLTPIEYNKNKHLSQSLKSLKATSYDSKGRKPQFPSS